MKKSARFVVFAALIMSSVAAAQKAPDPRLATARKAWVVPVDELGDDRLVANCVAERLHTATPMEKAATKDEADVILTVKANVTSGAKRVMLGAMGGTPSARMEAKLPDGTVLWADGAKYRRGNGAVGVAATNAECGLANGLLKGLREAMQKARDQR